MPAAATTNAPVDAVAAVARVNVIKHAGNRPVNRSPVEYRRMIVINRFAQAAGYRFPVVVKAHGVAKLVERDPQVIRLAPCPDSGGWQGV